MIIADIEIFPYSCYLLLKAILCICNKNKCISYYYSQLPSKVNSYIILESSVYKFFRISLQISCFKDHYLIGVFVKLPLILTVPSSPYSLP